MSTRTSRKPRLKVYTEAHRNFIQVPSDAVERVRKHLLNQGINTAHPEPVTPGVVSIELAASVDVKRVQLMLDDWSKSR